MESPLNGLALAIALTTILCGECLAGSSITTLSPKAQTATVPLRILRTKEEIVIDATEYIKRNEGKVLKGGRHVVYDDANGKAIIKGTKVENIPTVGYGRNLAERGLSEDESLYLLKNDIRECYDDLNARYPWFSALPDNTKIVLLDLRFNMGAAKLGTFRNFLASMEKGDWHGAKEHLMDSAYAKFQVGARATRNRDLIGT